MVARDGCDTDDESDERGDVGELHVDGCGSSWNLLFELG